MPTAAISQGTGATGSTAHQFCLFVHALDVAKQPGAGSLYGADIDTLTITEKLGEAATAEFVIDDPLKALTVERADDVYICDHAGRSTTATGRLTDDLFRGFVSDVRREMDGLGWRWHVVALGLEALLDRRRLTSGVISGAPTVATAIQSIMQTMDGRISALSVDTGAITTQAGGLVMANGNMITGAVIPLAGKTYREAMEECVVQSDLPTITGSYDTFALGMIDVDVQGRLRYGIGNNISNGFLPYGLIADSLNIVEGTGALVTQAAPYNIEAQPDLSGYVSRVYVQGVDDVSSGWVTDAASELKWGRVEDYLYAPGATSAALRDAIGSGYIQQKRPILRVLLTLSDTHDRLIPNPAPRAGYTGWHVRSYSGIVSNSGLWATIGTPSGVVGMLWSMVKTFSGGGLHMTLELGFGGGAQAGASSLATGIADLSAQTKAAQRLVGTLDEVAVRSKAGQPTDADFDIPRDGFVVVDTTNSVVWVRINGLWQPAKGYEYAYTEFTAPVAVTATTEATANTIVTAPATTFDGTAVLIEFGSDYHNPPTAVIGRLWLYEDGSSIGEIGVLRVDTVASPIVPNYYRRRHTPSAGSHTYSIRGSTASGTYNIDAGAGGAATPMPGWIRITKA